MSRWMMPCACRYSRPMRRSRKICRAALSGRCSWPGGRLSLCIACRVRAAGLVRGGHRAQGGGRRYGGRRVAGGRRQAAGGRRQAAGGRRWRDIEGGCHLAARE
eukprot:scaffold127844_cov63-Phaeocystis_antarctica.AAC.4